MIIAIANQKGGQAKTTTAQAISTGAAKLGRKSLAIDFDPQSNLTLSMGGVSNDKSAYEFITGQATAGEAIQHLTQGDLIAASLQLATADTGFTDEERTHALREALKPIKKKYGVITIDCPPTLNTLLLNALVAADLVIIPMTADTYSLQGLYQLKESIDLAKHLNKSLKVGGVLFVKHSTRTILDRDLSEVIREKCKEIGIPVYTTCISNSVSVREAQTQMQSIFSYAPKSKPAKEYMQLIKEIGI